MFTKRVLQRKLSQIGWGGSEEELVVLDLSTGCKKTSYLLSASEYSPGWKRQAEVACFCASIRFHIQSLQDWVSSISSLVHTWEGHGKTQVQPFSVVLTKSLVYIAATRRKKTLRCVVNTL